MPTIVVDAALRAQLHGLTEELTFCDETGRILGHYFPTENTDADDDDPIIVLPQDQCPYTQEKLREMMKATGGTTLKEFWKKMGRT